MKQSQQLEKFLHGQSSLFKDISQSPSFEVASMDWHYERPTSRGMNHDVMRTFDSVHLPTGSKQCPD